jgi:hypothetical protein
MRARRCSSYLTEEDRGVTLREGETPEMEKGALRAPNLLSYIGSSIPIQ